MTTPKGRYSKEQKLAIVDEYNNTMQTVQQVAQKYNIGTRTLMYWIKGKNLEKGGNKSTIRVNTKHNITMYCKYCQRCERHMLLFNGDK